MQVTPITLLENIMWDSLPNRDEFTDELKHVFTGGDANKKIKMWKRMCVYSGVAQAVIDYYEDRIKVKLANDCQNKC